MTEYLKSRQDVEIVRKAISAARKLEMAEYGIREYKPAFQKASQAISDSLGCELRHTDAEGGRYFWRSGKRESIEYPDRISALKALLDEEIRWK